MQNKSRKVIIIAAVAFLVAVSLCYFLIFRPGRNHHPPAINALPGNALFFFKGNDVQEFYKKFSSEGELWSKLASNPSIKEIDLAIKTVDSLVSQNKKLVDFLKKNELILSIHKVSPSRVDVLVLLQTRNKIGYKEISDLVKTKKRFLFTKRIYKNIEIYDYQLTPQKSLVAFAIKDGVLLLSPNALLVENAIETMEINGSKEIPLARYCKVKAHENIFINFSQFSSFLEMFLSSETKDKVSELKYFGGIGKYEADFKKDFISMRGEIQVIDSNKDFISLFYSQKPMPVDIYRFISDRTSFLISYQLENFSRYYGKYIQRLKTLNYYQTYKSQLEGFEKKYHLSIKNDIIPLLGGQFSLVINEPIDKDLRNSVLVFIKVNNMEKAMRLFRQKEDQPGNDAISDSDETSVAGDRKIYKSGISQSFELLFGKSFKMNRESFFTTVRDYMVFSSNYENLKHYMDDYANGLTLGNSRDFAGFSDKLISDANFSMYLNPFRCVNLPEQFSDSSFVKKFRDNSTYFSNFNFLAFNLANNNNSFYSEVITKYAVKGHAAKENLFAVQLEAPVACKPVVVKNSATLSNDILVIDEKNNFYSINSTGSINWKVKLDSKPVGDINTIDLFDNGKTQYLIETGSQLCLIDRLGRNAGSYPISLPKNAVNELVLVSGKDVTKYFIGCRNSIYGYEKSGKPLSAWNPKKIRGSMISPLKSFSRGNKLYVFGVTDQGTFYLWDTKGREVFSPVELKTRFKNPFFILFGSGDKNTYFISMDTTAVTCFINMDGEVEKKTIGKHSNESYFSVADFNNDGERELLYIEGTELTAFSPGGKKLYFLKLETIPLKLPDIINVNDKNYMVYQDRDKNYFYATDIQGNPLKNFPVNSGIECNIYDVNKDNVLEVIRSERNMLYLSRF